MELKIMVLTLQRNFAHSADVLMLDAIFVVKMTADSMKLNVTEAARMTTIKRERVVLAI
jgi:hypothetical protein